MDKLELAEQIAVVSGCLYLSWRIIKYVWSFLEVEEDPVTVLVTGAAGMFLLITHTHTHFSRVSFYTTRTRLEVSDTCLCVGLDNFEKCTCFWSKISVCVEVFTSECRVSDTGISR